MVDSIYDTVKFFSQAIVGADIKVAFEQGVKGVIEILFGNLGLAALVGLQSRLIVVFDLGNEISDRIRRWCLGRRC